ncbi:MAG: C1 family peptidase, partial [Acutalibacteraceae bacterium]|nr:C1 family peptidase [Acutalibacteraceae bacterium]
DRTLEYERPDDIIVINSASEYYKLTGKKYKVPSGGSLKSSLPSSVDNSKSIYFPTIGNQLQVNSCVAWAQTYYQFTYEMNKSQDIPTTAENTFSPKWAYNLQSFGMDFGAISDDVYNVMIGQGVAPMSLVPYDEDTTSWSPTEDVWSTALKYRLKGFQYFDEPGLENTRITSVDDSDLDAIKAALSNGEVLTYSTYIASWKTTRIQPDPAAPENQKYAGEEIVITQNGYEGGHRMALVGYNDNIWTDINNNCRIDEGEMGAFKVANSWGDSYGNQGYIWIAYDALNDGSSSVEGAPDYGYKTKIFEFIARIDVEPVKDNSDMYVSCTLNTSNRGDVDIYLIAEKNGTVATEVGFATTKYYINAGGMAFDGTRNSSDATLAFALNSVIPDISSENFHEYSWSVKFVDKENNFAPLTVKNVAIVDAGENKVYTPQNFTPFTLENEERTVDITSSEINDIVIYYCGYYNPTLHYKTSNSKWQSVKMEENPERYGYTHKFVIESENPDKATLYFTDSDGDVDNNNGKYYQTDGRFNHYVTANQAKPLFADVTIDSTPDVDKLMTYIATAEGGYAPYRYEFKLTRLNDGTERIREYTHESYVDWGMRGTGDYRITVNVKDQSNKIVTANYVFHVDDKPFNFASLTANPDKQIMVGDSVKFTAVSEFESAIDWGATPSMYDCVIKKTDTDEVVHVVSKRADESDFYHKKV